MRDRHLGDFCDHGRSHARIQPQRPVPGRPAAPSSPTQRAAFRQALQRHPAGRAEDPRVGCRLVQTGLVTAASLPLVRVLGGSVARAADPTLTNFVCVYAPHGVSAEWQYAAARVDSVPEWVLRAAGGITIAVIDTGADLAAPDLAAKTPLSYNVRALGAAVSDPNGHGTFVASLAAGSSSNGDGIAGSSGDARLMVVEAADRHGSFTDVDEAAAIVYAVDHGARIINLSLGGPTTSSTERRAVDYAVSRCPAGRGDRQQPPRREPGRVSGRAPAARRLAGVGGRGSRSVRRRSRARASFSNTGTHISSQRPATPSSAPSPPPPPSRAIRASAFRARPRALRLRQRHVVCHSAGGRCCGARLGGEPTASRQGGRSDSQAHGLRRRKVEPAARLRRPRRRCSRGAGAGIPAQLERAQASTRSI